MQAYLEKLTQVMENSNKKRKEIMYKAKEPHLLCHMPYFKFYYIIYTCLA